MNIYFIVEGRRTERKVYPAWLNHLLPEIKKIDVASEAINNNYYLFSGGGFPALLNNHLKNSIDEVNELGNYKYLVLVLDVDESTIDGRVEEVNRFIEENDLVIENAELILIPQNRCIETWFLGNKKIFKNNPQSSVLSDYIKFYNVRDNDPENMGLFPSFNTHSQFHANYCTEFLRERNIRYSKNRPNGVTELGYLESLIERQRQTSHLESFKLLIDFCEKVKTEL